MKRLLLFFLLVASIFVEAQTPNALNWYSTDASTRLKGKTSPYQELMLWYDSLNSSGSLLKINTTRVQIPKLASRNDGLVTGKVLWIDGSGNVKFSPKDSLGIFSGGSGISWSALGIRTFNVAKDSSLVYFNGLFYRSKTKLVSASDTGLVTPVLKSLWDSKFGSGTAVGGDLTGTLPNPTVSGLKGVALPTLSPGYIYYNGTSLIMQSPSGSGTVNSGTQYRLGYYATTGTAVSEAPAITGNRALISDANGVPTHSGVNSTELANVSGVTGPIQAQIDGKQATFGAQPVGTFYAGPVTGSSAAPIFRRPRRSDHDSLDVPIGVLITTQWPNKTGWTDYGTATITAASSELVLTNASGTLDFASGTENTGYGNSNYDNISIDLPIRVGTVNSTNFGVGINFKSNHGTAGSKRSVAARVSFATGDVGRLTLYQSDGTGVILATDAKTSNLPTTTISANDSLVLNVKMIRTTYIVTLYKRVTGANKVINTLSYTVPLPSPLSTDFVRNNCWRYAIQSFGGTNYITRGYTVTCLNNKYAPVLWVGDSMFYGQGASSVDNTATSIIDKRLGIRSQIYASGGNRTDEEVVAEILATQAKLICPMLGINNITKGDNAATFGTKIAAFYNALIAGGRTIGVDVIPVLIPPFSVDATAYNTEVTNYINTLALPHRRVWIDMFAGMRDGTLTSLPAAFTDDGTHWSDIGQRKAADVLYGGLQPFLPYNPKPISDQSYLVQDVNGNVNIGTAGGAKPAFKLQVVSSTSGISQDAMVNVTDTKAGGGLYASGTLAGGVLFGQNSRFNGSSHIPYATATSQISMVGGDVVLYGQSGLTIGAASTLVRRATIGSTGNFIINGTTSANNSQLNIREDYSTNNGLYASVIGNGFHLSSGLERVGGAWTTRGPDVASFGQSTGVHIWYSATGQLSNTAIALASFEKMRLDANGNLMIGISTAPLSLTKSFIISTGGALASTDVAGVALTGQLRAGVANTDGVVITAGQSALKTQHIISDRVGIGTITPTAILHIKAGTAAANTAPLKFTAGANLTTPEAGAVEFDGTHFYGTIGTTRYQLDQQGNNPLTTTGDIIYSSSGTTAARRAIGSTNDYLKVTGGVPVWASFSTDVQAIGDARYVIKAFASIGSNYTLTAADHTILNTGSSTYTLTLPDAATMPGQQFELKIARNATGSFILNTTGGQTVDGLASGAVTVDDYTKVESSGSNWFIMSPNRRSGAATLTYDGVTTVFNIPHGLGTTPASIPLSARDMLTHFNGVPTVTVGTTNITITYSLAPSAGSNVIDWAAFK